jgi:hypothetical protein
MRKAIPPNRSHFCGQFLATVFNVHHWLLYNWRGGNAGDTRGSRSARGKPAERIDCFGRMAPEALSRRRSAWLARAASHPGSWWPDWYEWLRAHRGGERKAPAAAGNAQHPPLMPAPGGYVVEKAG